MHRDDFEGTLDLTRWLPHYLPHWSTREESAATWQVEGSVLDLSIPVDQGLWCAATHDEPLRVSGIQSGACSGPVGSTVGQQPFVPDQAVVSEEPLWAGWTPRGGLVEVRARMDLSPRSMASVWLVGLEDVPDRCGEICVFEIFGDAIGSGDAEVGSGIHPFRDPVLVDDFAAPRLPLDPGVWHTYGVDWHDDRVDLLVDGAVTRSVPQSPAYPMQLMVAVFDFPARSTAATDGHVPHLQVDWISVRI